MDISAFEVSTLKMEVFVQVLIFAEMKLPIPPALPPNQNYLEVPLKDKLFIVPFHPRNTMNTDEQSFEIAVVSYDMLN